MGTDRDIIEEAVLLSKEGDEIKARTWFYKLSHQQRCTLIMAGSILAGLVVGLALGGGFWLGLFTYVGTATVGGIVYGAHAAMTADELDLELEDLMSY